MSQIGKASTKRGKPSYFMSVLGVTIVLFFIGIFGWIFLSADSYTKALKEDVKIVAYLHNNAKKADVDSLQAYLAAKPYTKFIEYVDQETAKKRFIAKVSGDPRSSTKETAPGSAILFIMRSPAKIFDFSRYS